MDLAYWELFSREPTFEGYPEVGVFVMDAAAATVQRINSEPRYHLAWAGNDMVASACPYYMACTDGMALTDLRGRTTLPVGSGVLNLAPAEDNRNSFQKSTVGPTLRDRT